MKTIIITGCARGIGEAMAEYLCQDYAIIAIDIEKPRHSYYAKFYQCDLRDTRLIVQTAQKIKEEHLCLYALINNAGQFEQEPLMEQTLQEWNNVLTLNLTAPYLLSKEFAGLLSQEHGHIINIASTRAIMSEEGTEAYSASKGGLKSLTHALGASLSGKVSVNSISPGWINTDTNYLPSKEEDAWHFSGRVGKPIDIAQMVAFLLNQKDGFITGSDFIIDGGVSKKMVY